MNAMTRLACAVALPLFAWQAVAWQTGTPPGIRRLYVEPFATEAGAEKLREDVLPELRKISSIPLVSDESSADLTLAGGGEIWITGYFSLNPRSGRLPSSGTPVYAGFLSVELKDRQGQTLWSYLVTPEAATE